MHIELPDAHGAVARYELSGKAVPAGRLDRDSVRTVFAAAHVVADPYRTSGAADAAAVDWDRTLAFRHHLAELGLGIAEAMDTAQRGMGLDWLTARELIQRTAEALPDAMVYSGCGTDQLVLTDRLNLDMVRDAYLEQVSEVQSLGSRVIMMASRALAAVASGGDDYARIYGEVLSACDQPVILHWLGEMFDPQLAGYWGGNSIPDALANCLAIIRENESKIEGIKVSLLDKQWELELRRTVPANVKVYTGDDFNYPELIAGDDTGYSHALLGIFDPLAAIAAYAVAELSRGNTDEFRGVLDPTVPLARQIFRAPTQHYKTGVVFLAWLNGFQDHFIMVNGAQADRPLIDLVDTFKLADACGALRDPELAVDRMRKLLAVYGL